MEAYKNNRLEPSALNIIFCTCGSLLTAKAAFIFHCVARRLNNPTKSRTKCIHCTECQAFCPFIRIGSPLTQASVASPLDPRGETDSLAGVGSGGTQFRRRDKNSGTLCILQYNPSAAWTVKIYRGVLSKIVENFREKFSISQNSWAQHFCTKVVDYCIAFCENCD